MLSSVSKSRFPSKLTSEGSSTAAYCPSFASSTSSLIWIGVRTHLDHPFHLLLRRRTGKVGNAKTAGLENHLGLSDSQWTWVLNSFYICYVLFEWTTVLWKLLPAHIYVTMLCICWGAAAMCTGAVDNMAELIICRCFLGVFEAAFGAGAPYFLSLFYQRYELGLRVSLLLGMSPVANCFASALAYGITQIRHSTASWRYLFIIEGAPTVIFSVVVFFFLPDSPGTAKFLTETEQTHAVERLQTVDRTAKTRLYRRQVFNGLADYKNYVHMAIHFCCNFSFAGLSNFSPHHPQRHGVYVSRCTGSLCSSLFRVILAMHCGSGCLRPMGRKRACYRILCDCWDGWLPDPGGCAR